MAKWRISKDTWKIIKNSGPILYDTIKEIIKKINEIIKKPGKIGNLEKQFDEMVNKFEFYGKTLEEQAEVIKGLTEQNNRLVDVLRILERKVNILIWVSISVSILAIAAVLIALFK